MNRTPYNPIVFDLTDILAFIVKKALLIVLVCIICAGLGIVYNYLNAKSEKTLEQFDRDMEEYNAALTNAKNNLGVLESKRNRTIESMNEDPVFEIYNAQEVYECTTSFLVSSEDDVVISESGNMIYPNQEQLKVFFGSLNLSELLNTDTKSSYLSKLIILSAKGNNIIIKVYHHNKDVAEEWSDKVFQIISEFATENRGWSISGRYTTVESYQGQYILGIVEEYNTSLSETDKLISEQKKEIKSLNSSIPSVMHVLRYSVIGFVLGGFLSVLILLLVHIKRNPVTKSFIAEKKMGKPFLGALFADNYLFDRLARSIIGERRYLSDAASADFIKNNLRSIIPADKKTESVAILCSCSEKEVGKQSKIIESILSDCDCKSVLVTDASVNPESINAINNSDAVLILERQWRSKWNLVSVSMDLTERMDKQVIGFILC